MVNEIRSWLDNPELMAAYASILLTVWLVFLSVIIWLIRQVKRFIRNSRVIDQWMCKHFGHVADEQALITWQLMKASGNLSKGTQLVCSRCKKVLDSNQ